MKKLPYSFLLITLSSILLINCSRKALPNRTFIETKATANYALGNPSDATAGKTNYLNYLMKAQYTLSYNRDRSTPNWVSWPVDKSWIGSADRQNDFRSDGSLPASWYHVQPTDYSNTGFDRGHNCPSVDRTSSIEDNSATFLMTNMIPQAPDNNQLTWEKLESYSRGLVDSGNELYIIMRTYGKGGSGSMGKRSTIADGKITVPATLWKVIVVLPEGSNDMSRINSTTRVIAVSTTNSNGLSTDWGVQDFCRCYRKSYSL